MNTPSNYLLEFNGRLYTYDRADILRIALFENARQGIIPDRLFRLVPDGLSYTYVPMEADELEPSSVVEVPVQTIELVA